MNIRVVFFILLFFQQMLAVSGNCTVNQQPVYVWIDQTGEGRNVYAYFRNEFTLNELPDDATLKLYAKSLYTLYVNGQFVNFGPVRSYETHPYFDSINIAPFLVKGKNVIAVKVHSNGIHTYQVPFGTAGFVAMGTVSECGRKISLATPGNWVARKATGYNSLSPRFSFAQGPVEIYDARMEPDDWKSGNINTNMWSKPVVLKNQQYFGKLAPRPIPLLTNTEFSSRFVVNKLDLSSGEFVFKWSSYYENVDNPQDLRGILQYSYIYSPFDQEVEMGFSWGKYWINGRLAATKGQPEKPFRSNATVSLKKGWNSFFSIQEIIWSNLDGMLALPETNNLQFSIRKLLNDSLRFAITDPIEVAQLKTVVAGDVCPAEPEKLIYKWSNLSGTEPLYNPAKEIAWLEKKKIPVNPLVTENIIIPAGYQQAVVYDMGTIHLGRLYLKVDAPAGTTFDLVWSEDLKDSLVTLFRRFEINAIARFVSDGSNYFETFRPYGLRYLQVNVRNHTSPVTIQKVGIYSQIYDFQKTGSFSCSDPVFNSIWEMGWRTLQVCSEDAYTDTPFRERGHYAGDLFPQFATTLATSGDPRLALHTIRLFNQMYKSTYSDLAPTIHADYPLINILVASWYIRLFNDKEFAREVFPAYANYLRKLYATRQFDELYKISRVFIEWIAIDKTADLTALQSYIYASFSNLSAIAHMLDRPKDAVEFETMATELKELMLAKCWDETAGNFVDGFKEDKVLPTRHVISSSLASVWKIPAKKQDKRIQHWFDDALINIGPPVNRKQLTTPYGGFYALASLYQSGNVATAENFIRTHWGKMLYEGNDLTWEDFNRDGKSTLSHAWSSSPTYYMSSQILGVDLGFPGYLSADTIYIRPQSNSVSWAKGTVPHPRGLVTVDWKVAGNVLFLNYVTPAGVPVVVQPRGRLAKLRLVVNRR
jgi:hypothetical protein